MYLILILILIVIQIMVASFFFLVLCFIVFIVFSSVQLSVVGQDFSKFTILRKCPPYKAKLYHFNLKFIILRKKSANVSTIFIILSKNVFLR